MCFASSNFRWSQTIWVTGTMAEILIILSSWAWPMNILSCHVLIMKAYDIPMVATDVSLFILVRTLKCLQIIKLCWIGWLRTSYFSIDIMLWCTMYTWQFFWRLATMSTCTWAIHAQLMSNVTHVLWRSKVLQNILHLLYIICASAWSKRCLIMEATMAAFDAHISDSTWRYQIKT